MSEIEKFEYLVLSPGPGIPDEAGELKNIISRFGSSKKILGVCLGHQAIAEVYGAKLKNLSEVYHGVDSEINITLDHYLFNNLKKPLNVGRYHSWVVEEPVPDCLEILAYDDKNHIMALKHKELNITGVQFHPESILTNQGKEMLKNWLKFS
jgi:anthranilate synthase component 2